MFHVNSIFDVPADSSVTEEQLTRPRRETSATSKNGPSKCWKIFPFGMAVFRRGWLLKKKQPLAVLRDKGGNGRCPLWFLKNKPEYSLIKARIKVIHVRETIRVCWGVQ